MKQLRRSIIFLIISHLVLPAYSSQKHPGEDQQNPRSSKRTRHAQQVPTQAQLNRQLLSAAKKGNAQEVRSLIQSGADKEATDGLGRRSLHYAALKGHPAIIDILLSVQANILARDEHRATPLHYAALIDHTDIVVTLARAGADLHAINSFGWTPLHSAANNDSCETIVALVKAGSDIEAIANVAHNTALHIAVENYNALAVKTLIELGANKEAVNRYGDTPLRSITQLFVNDLYNNSDNDRDSENDYWGPIIKNLIESGANIMVTNIHEYDTIPEMLCEAYTLINNNKRKNSLKRLIENLMKKYEENSQLITDDKGNTLFHLFFSRIPGDRQHDLNKRAIRALLKKYGRHIASNTKNMYGLTPLHIAAKNSLLTRHLINNFNANPRATTPCGDTMMSLARIWTDLTPQPDWTLLMRTVHQITKPDATALQTVQNALDHCDDPEFITAQYHSALSVAQCPEIKAIIKKHILTTRRHKISEDLQIDHNQPAVLANLQLQFAGTYEPQA